jgi:hypothetical protein
MGLLEAQLGRSSAQLSSAAALLEELPGEGSARSDALLELLHAWQVHSYRQLLLADLRACLGAVQLLQQEERRLVEEVGAGLPSFGIGWRFGTLPLHSGGTVVLRLAIERPQPAPTQLLSTIGASEAVPRDRVLPLFVSLGATRAAITEEVRLLVVHQRLVDRLAELAQAAQPLLLRSALGGNASVASLPEAQELGVEEVEQASIVAGC